MVVSVMVASVLFAAVEAPTTSSTRSRQPVPPSMTTPEPPVIVRQEPR